MGNMNSYNAAQYAGEQGFPDVWISKYIKSGSRDMRSSSWKVCRPGHKTDPQNWHYGYNKSFVMWERNDPKALQEAMDWAKEQYGVEEWVKVPGFAGDYFPKQAAKAITVERKRRLAE